MKGAPDDGTADRPNGPGAARGRAGPGVPPDRARTPDRGDPGRADEVDGRCDDGQVARGGQDASVSSLRPRDRPRKQVKGNTMEENRKQEPRPEVELSGSDGNAFAIIGTVSK